MMTVKFILLSSVLLLYSLCEAQSMSEEFQERQNFEKMATYLSMGSGKWTGENKNYDPNNLRSPKAFGLWFEQSLNNLLTIAIVAYMKDTTILSSQGIFTWHPEKKNVIHITANRRNGFSEGVSEFPNDSTFISKMTDYRPDGNFVDHKDENFIVSENVHRNTSYSKDDHGNWVEKGNWIWKRDPE